MSQYCIDAEALPLPLFQRIHCSHALPLGFGEPAQAVASVKKSLLIWSVYALATAGPELAMGPLSLVTLVTFSKCPIAWVMCPEGAPAEMSLLFPTTAGRGARRGNAGMVCGFPR